MLAKRIANGQFAVQFSSHFSHSLSVDGGWMVFTRACKMFVIQLSIMKALEHKKGHLKGCSVQDGFNYLLPVINSKFLVMLLGLRNSCHTHTHTIRFCSLWLILFNNELFNIWSSERGNTPLLLRAHNQMTPRKKCDQAHSTKKTTSKLSTLKSIQKLVI